MSNITVSRISHPRARDIRRLFNFITPTLGLKITARKLEAMTRSTNGKLEVEVKKNGLYVDGNRLSWSRMVGHRLYGQIDKMSIKLELKGKKSTGRRLIRETMNSIILSKMKYRTSCFREVENIDRAIQAIAATIFGVLAPTVLILAWGRYLWRDTLSWGHLGLTASIPFGARVYQKFLSLNSGEFQFSNKIEKYYKWMRNKLKI
jgi:hypothetical protein